MLITHPTPLRGLPGDGTQAFHAPRPGSPGRAAADIEQGQLLLGGGLAEVAHKGWGVVHHLHASRFEPNGFTCPRYLLDWNTAR